MTYSPSFSLSDKSSLTFLMSLIILFFIGILIPRLMAFLPFIMGAGFFLHLYFSQKKILKLPKNDVIFFGFIFILALLSSLWAPNQIASIEKSFKLLGIFVFGLCLVQYARLIKWPSSDVINKVLIGVLFISLAFLVSEKMTNHQIIQAITKEEVFSFKLNMSFVVLSLFLVPAFFYLTKLDIKKPLKIIIISSLILMTLYGFYLTESQTAQLCFIVGIFFLFIFPIRIRILTNILMVLTIIFCLAFPFTIAPVKSLVPEDSLKSKNYFINQTSLRYRLDIWNYAAEKTMESPIYGNGIVSLRYMTGTYMKHQRAYNALHAHNSVLQIWAEFGLIGALLACSFLIYIFKSIGQIKNGDLRRLYLASFMACLCCSLTGYGLWQSWQLGMFFAVTALTIALGKKFLKTT